MRSNVINYSQFVTSPLNPGVLKAPMNKAAHPEKKADIVSANHLADLTIQISLDLVGQDATLGAQVKGVRPFLPITGVQTARIACISDLSRQDILSRQPRQLPRQVIFNISYPLYSILRPYWSVFGFRLQSKGN
jgi:hypothetical protein